ncbi:MAG: cyanophycin synthetase, partial [Candidatus Margulisiibacteriota bacterium]
LARIKVSKQAVLKGLQKVNWPGRFQIVSKKPLTIVDGAHNPAGIKVLVETLRHKFTGRKWTFIIGAQQDKDLSSMLKLLRPAAKQVILTHSSHRNAANRNSIALGQALKRTKQEDRVIAGSLFLAADALKCLDAD